MEKEIVFAGFGGQGIILMGVIFSPDDGKFPRSAGDSGPILRAGFPEGRAAPMSSFPDEKINFPKAARPDLMIFMSEESVKRYVAEGDPEKTLVIYDSTLIRSIPAAYKQIFPVPATRIAEEELKSRIVANMFMLGAIIERIVPGSFPVLRQVVSRSVPPKSEALNIKALEAGYEFARTQQAA